VITLEGLNKSFDGICAVRDLSVSIGDGEVFGLVGPNGAGKTTTIKMMAGLLRPDEGKISIGAHNISREPIRAKSIMGYVPDKAFLYDKLTAREFLIFISSIYGMEKSEALERTASLLDLFGIKDREDDLIESYSQGMRQRLLFVQALLHEPEVLLIDEPFTGLDPFGVKMLKGIIRKLRSDGVTVFLATHSLHIAEELCDRVGFINRGALISVKSREEIAGIEGGLEGLFLDMGF
jgi:ABC-2 type transport system ATP-binding protein